MRGRERQIEKPVNFKKTLKRLINYLKEFKLGLSIVLVLAVGSSIFSIAGPKVLGKITNEIARGSFAKYTSQPGIDFAYIKKIILLLLILYIGSMLFQIIENFIINSISHKISYRLRENIIKKINKIPLKYLESRKNGEILSLMTNDVDTMSNNLCQILTQIITSIVTLLGVIIMMISISIPMTIVSLLVLPISISLLMLIVSKSQKYFVNQQDNLAKINSRVEEIYGAHVIVKTNNQEENSIKEFAIDNDKLYETSWKSQFYSGLMMPAMDFIGNLGYVIISIFGGYLTIKGKLQVGYILSFSQYIRQFNQPISTIAQITNLLQSTVAASERIFNFLDVEEEKILTGKIDKNEVRGTIEFKDVTFGYNEDKIIIRNFNLKVKPGEKVAIVGPTGAGKTTLVKLLMHFYDTNSGIISIDGQEINKINRNELRDTFGMVLQDTWLFNDTIANNIQYGNLDASLDDIKKVSKMSHIDHFIKTLPDNYQMIINEESNNISEGEKQLLTIARVILKNPRILILDEATSSVDTRLEQLIQDAMDKLMEKRTSFIIAHRLSTIKNADMILVLNEGSIVEQGTHQELLNKKGFYYNLYNSQFE